MGLHTHAGTGLPQGGSALHTQVQKGSPRCKAKKGNAAHGGGKKEGRFLPSKVNVSLTEFASTLACKNNKTQSTPALIPLCSEDLAKENVHRILEEQNGLFNRCFCKQLGQVVSPTGQFWPKADEVCLISGRRDALMMQRCLLVLGDVLFASRNIQALSGPGHVRTQYFPPSASLAARRPSLCIYTSCLAA